MLVQGFGEVASGRINDDEVLVRIEISSLLLRNLVRAGHFAGQVLYGAVYFIVVAQGVEEMRVRADEIDFLDRSSGSRVFFHGILLCEVTIDLIVGK